MKLFKSFNSVSKNSMGVVILLILTASVAAASYNIIAKSNAEKFFLKDSLSQADKKIADLTNELGSAKVEAETFRKDYEAIVSKFETNNGQVEAFAKQAAACEKVKKQLNIKN
jgi:hypothetical protein